MKFIGALKWVLAILGTTRGSIVGGFIGFIVGYIIEEYIKGNLSVEFKDTFEAEGENIKYTVHQNRLLALIVEIIKADGYIHKEEIYFVKQFLLKQYGSAYTNMMMKTLKLQIDKRFDVRNISKKLNSSINYQEKIKIITFLYGIAIQNGSISIKEKKILDTVAHHIGISQADYIKIINPKNQQKQQKRTQTKSKVYGYNPYKVLGISEGASFIEIKKAYRKMVLKFHPDKTDIDDEIANEKFSEISEAYTIIKKKRGFK